MSKENTLKKSTLETLKVTGDYLKSIYGILSTLPALAGLIGTWAEKLRVSSVIKPIIYIYLIIFTLFAFFYQAGKYIKTTASSSEFNQMGKRAIWHFVGFVVAFGCYWVGIKIFEIYLPEAEWLQQILLYIFAFIFAFSFFEITCALAILGLRVYIARK